MEPVASMLKERGLDVESVVRHGHPAGTLIELANERGVAQIIIGRRGEGGPQTNDVWLCRRQSCPGIFGAGNRRAVK